MKACIRLAILLLFSALLHALPAQAQRATIKLGGGSDYYARFGLLSGEVGFLKRLSVQGSIGFGKNRGDNPASYTFNGLHGTLQAKAYLLMRHHRPLRGIYFTPTCTAAKYIVAPNLRHSNYRHPYWVGVGGGFGLQQVLFGILVIDAGYTLNYVPRSWASRDMGPDVYHFSYLQLGIAL